MKISSIYKGTTYKTKKLKKKKQAAESPPILCPVCLDFLMLDTKDKVYRCVNHKCRHEISEKAYKEKLNLRKKAASVNRRCIETDK